MFNSNVMAWVVTIGGILLGGGILYGILDAKLSREKFSNELKSSNFSIDHLMPGSVLVAFDDSKRQVAFVARDGIFKFPTTALDSGPYTGLSAMVSTYQTRFIFASRIRATLSSMSELR
jgi:hypothetical protein